MSYNAAHIDSPEVIKNFRNDYIKFQESCRQAISGAKTDSARVQQWLLYQQSSYWKQELSKREQKVEQAKSAYLLARFGHDSYKKTSYLDEQKRLRLAEEKRDEARRKIAAVKKWTMTLERQADKLMGPINVLSGLVDASGAGALAQLEHLIQSLEAYLRERPSDTGAGA